MAGGVQVLYLKNKCDSIERREQESCKLEEKIHNEEGIQALKKTNSQLQIHMYIPHLLLILLHHLLLLHSPLIPPPPPPLSPTGSD